MRDVAHQQQRFAEAGADNQLIFTLERRVEQGSQDLGGGRGVPTFEVRSGPGHDRLQWRADHGAQYTKYPVRPFRASESTQHEKWRAGTATNSRSG